MSAANPAPPSDGKRISEPNKEFCERLVELAFPASIRISGTAYSPNALLQAMIKEERLQHLMQRRFFLGKARDAQQVVDRIFRERKIFGEQGFNENDLKEASEGNPEPAKTWGYSKEELRAALQGNPKLQKAVAVRTHYVPSKWLLEQEMWTRGIWPPAAATPDGIGPGGPARLSEERPAGRSTAGVQSFDGAEDVYRTVAIKGLLGVCFSGGGIRSATFNLGVIQALAQVGLLPRIDMLSSVSGGGYIHEFLAAWILRHPHGRDGVIAELIPQAEPGCLPRSPEPIKWLMRYASYLTPSRGLLSTDTWTLVAIWLRNTILNQIPTVFGLALGFFLVHLLVLSPLGEQQQFPDFGIWLTAVGWLLLGWATYSLMRLKNNLQLQQNLHEGKTTDSSLLLDNWSVQRLLTIPWLALSVWLSYCAQLGSSGFQWASPRIWSQTAWWRLATFLPSGLWVVGAVMVVIFAGGVMDAYDDLHTDATPGQKRNAKLGFILAGLIAAAVACAFGFGFFQLSGLIANKIAVWISLPGEVQETTRHALSLSLSGAGEIIKGTLETTGIASRDSKLSADSWRIQLALLPALLLSVPYIGIELALGLVGRDFTDMRREWLARMRAWSLLYGMLWGGVITVALMGPYLGLWLAAHHKTLWTSIGTFLAAHFTTVAAGWSSKADGKPTGGGILGFKPLDFAALLAVPVTVLGILLLVSCGSSWAVDGLYPLKSFQSLGGWAFFGADGFCALIAGAVAGLFGWRVDINDFSMISFYCNRLTRCYLGATVPNRRPDPFSGFDERSEIVLANGESEATPPKVRDLLPVKQRSVYGVEGKYEGPFPIFCATLNLTTGEDLATQERKGASFAFTPLYSGYSVPWTDAQTDDKVSYNGFVPTEDYAYLKGGIHVDTAVAISGAAVNPNMGYNTNPVLAFLMTFLNVRLGWWISNTRKTDQWQAGSDRPTPRFAAAYLFRELIGKVNDAAPYVNLSDGGHFENMGLYELVRRRCRYIIVCDAEGDPEMKFDGIGGAVTKCRTDFGAEIDLDLRPLRIDPKTGYSKTHCVVGTIRYPPPPEDWTGDGGSVQACCPGQALKEEGLYTGKIVYIKSSLVGDEPADLLAYKIKNSVFPQDSTANQWFQETQFEAYRRLGHHVAMSALEPALPAHSTAITDPTQIPDLFKRMYAIWYPRTPEMEEFLGEHLDRYEAVLRELREKRELVGLEAALNDGGLTSTLRKRPISGKQIPFVGWATLVPLPTGANVLYATQFANSLLDLMVAVYLDLKLAFPDNRKSPHSEWWICQFRRWCRVDVVQDTWLSHNRMYPQEFRYFAKRELNLPD